MKKYGYYQKEECYNDFKDYMQKEFNYNNDFYKLLNNIFLYLKNTTNWDTILKSILEDIDDINEQDFKILNNYDWRVNYYDNI